MNVDGNDVIQILSHRIGQLEVELAVKTAQLAQVEQQQTQGEVEDK
ncbi:hypothetical protein RGU11_06785 [Rossellomorea marisflavi]|nr:hypothetical protein [Rossellomorea marisflavi]MDR4936072.1 hypothetical protein [Rossellomorea marisflavi]